MRRITACLAALISLLFVFTSISASACDLSCWLRQEQSGCHSGVPTSMSGEEASAAMTATMPMAMPMGSEQMQHMTPPDKTGLDHRLTPMPPQTEMAVERWIERSKPGMNSTARPDRSRDLSSCAHETCSQIWASASPPAAGHAQLDFLHHAPACFSTGTISLARSNGIKTAPPPPELHTEHPAAERAAILRV
jgi:hypothetical protein